MAILMKYEGIDGESKVAGYEGQLELLSFTWGVGRTHRFTRSATGDTDECTVTDVSLLRKADGKSAALLRETFYGEFDRNAVVSFVRTGGLAPVELMQYVFEDCGLTNYTISHSDPDGYPVENLTLAFRRVTCLAYPIDNTLRAPPDDTSFDVTTGRR